MALCEQEGIGAVRYELQDEESVWAEPVDEGLSCWNWHPGETENSKYLIHATQKQKDAKNR